MNSLITQGVEITVETFYQQEYSNPVQGEFMFAYRITLINHNSYPVQLLTRHWDIYDTNGERRVVDGEGVIGQQPVLATNETFQYVSGCNLKSEIGRMGGLYEMVNLYTNKHFEVAIPTFKLESPTKFN
jgi:ApaG protein